MDFDSTGTPDNTDDAPIVTSKGKRKPAKVTRDMVAPKSTVIPLRIEDMEIKVPGSGTCYFKRLKYKGCPKLSNQTAEFMPNTILIDMQRDGVIRELYQLLNANVSSTTADRFFRIIGYIKWLDSEEKTIPENDYWHEELTNAYIEHRLACVQKNLCSKGAVTLEKGAISWVLRQLNRKQQARELRSIKGYRASSNSHQGLHPDAEMKPIAKLLFKAYVELLRHFEKGTMPKRHPLWDEELAEKEATRMGLKGAFLANHKAAPSRVLTRGLHKKHPHNLITEVAMMITFMFTGMNLAPLSKMQIRDVRFKAVQGGKFLFDAEKDRAKYLELDSAMGFSKYAREFIEGWLSVTRTMSGGVDSAPLFPRYTQDGLVFSYNEKQKSPQQTINKLLPRLGLPKITSSILRKTKSDMLMRVTESMYLVSLSLNNEMKTVQGRYAHGHEADHRKNLSASMGAKMDIVRGKSVDDAVQENKFKVSDILDDYDYRRLREGENRTHESRTPLGVRCNDNTKGAAQLIKRAINKAGVNADKEEGLCTDFLACFECDQHALVADVEGIWLMLSFKDTMTQMQQTPSVNSMPKNQYSKIWNTITHILSLYADKAPSNYAQAMEKLKDAPHPLYANVHSLNDLLEIF